VVRLRGGGCTARVGRHEKLLVDDQKQQLRPVALACPRPGSGQVMRPTHKYFFTS
jgi:hypothetical protein